VWPTAAKPLIEAKTKRPHGQTAIGDQESMTKIARGHQDASHDMPEPGWCV
jgi:hypothetical protein